MGYFQKQIMGENSEINSFQGHPATCDCSGGKKCERKTGLGEGEMKRVGKEFICPCGEYIQFTIGENGNQVYPEKNSKQKKPLSELYKDKEACKKVAALIFGENLVDLVSIDQWGDELSFGIAGDDVDIYYSGEIFMGYNNRSVNAFDLVDRIRELGYEPVKG